MTPAPLRIAFRADAGIEIGTGHVMRCLTLATALKEHGADCVFLCRPHDGNLLTYITAQGFRAFALPPTADTNHMTEPAPPHAAWLGTDWATDARDCLAALAEHFGGAVDWLVVDHYALDARWETALRPACTRLMVIDDLADRPHDCDLLLDQSLGRDAADYAALVPPTATLLIGPRYALLRPEFAQMRAESLARRQHPVLRHVLVTMGGVDKDNATGRVLDALATCPLPEGVKITVVMGAQAPWLAEVRTMAAAMPVPTEVRVGVRDMAALMVESDLAIGGGGMTSIERCVLGLPSIMVIQAENQKRQGGDLAQAGAAIVHDLKSEGLKPNLQDQIAHLAIPGISKTMSRSAAALTDGKALSQIVNLIEHHNKENSGVTDQLVPMADHHVLQVLAWRNEPRVRQNMYSQHVISIEEHMAWWQANKARADRKYFVFNMGGRAVGFVSITDIDLTHGTASWAFFSASDAPQGTGTRMELATLKLAFEELRLRKLCCEVLEFNSRVVEFHKRFGFRIEGKLSAHKQIDDRYFDVILMAAFAEDWQKHIPENERG